MFALHRGTQKLDLPCRDPSCELVPDGTFVCCRIDIDELQRGPFAQPSLSSLKMAVISCHSVLDLPITISLAPRQRFPCGYWH